MNPPAVDRDSVLRSLSGAGLVSKSAQITSLSGGVSSSVWLIEDGQSRLVAKTPLAKLHTPADWFSDTSRGRVEYLTLQLLSTLTPRHVPRVMYFDDSLPLVTMSAAPAEWIDWRAALLSEEEATNWLRSTEVAQSIGSTLGQMLTTWHSNSTDRELLPHEVVTGDRLRQLRTDPFHRATSVQMSKLELASKLLELANELESVQVCLAYGDYSPKNVLVGKDGLWVIDAETAHFGHPVIDTAFLSAHLLLKSIHRPELSAAMFAAWQAFTAAYENHSTSEDVLRYALAELSSHTGAILASRVLGVSQAKYLSESSRRVVLNKAEELLMGAEIAEIWQ